MILMNPLEEVNTAVLLHLESLQIFQGFVSRFFNAAIALRRPPAPCSQTQDYNPSDMIDGKIWPQLFLILNFLAVLFSQPLAELFTLLL